jgi:1,4-dihydroxy-2-naphthoate octaprenyltransferase
MPPVTAWWLAIRPKTLSLSAAPVIVGNSLAWCALPHLSWTVAVATLLASLLIQIGTNLYNDAADHERGTDGADRLGPPRATAQGWLRAGQVKRGAAVSFVGAFLLGLYLVAVGGWPILILGLLSLAAGYTYTGGPRPIAYSASGELFVFIFFGLWAVGGSYYLQTSRLSYTALAAGAALGLLAAAVLLVNNYRDLDSDRRAHKLTLCHWLGRERSRRLFAVLLLVPFLLPLAWPRGAWPVLLALPFALVLLRRLTFQSPGPGLNAVLADTARLQLGYSLLLVAGLLL